MMLLGRRRFASRSLWVTGRARHATAQRSQSRRARRTLLMEDLTLTVEDIRAESGRQLGLLEEARDRRLDRLADIDRKLRARMQNVPALHKVVEVSPWHPVPEMRALKIPLDPASNDTFTPLHGPLLITVREGEAYRPLAVRLKKGWQEICGIDDRWEFDLWWLPHPVTRSYFSVTDTAGQRLVLYRDKRDGCWYQQNLYR